MTYSCCEHCTCNPKKPQPSHSYACGHGCNDGEHS